MTPDQFAMALVEQLPELQLPETFKAVHCHALSLEGISLKDLQLLVAAEGIRRERHDQSGWMHVIRVQIGILQKLPQKSVKSGLEDSPRVTELLGFVHQLASQFEQEDYEGPFGFEVESIENDPLYDPEFLVKNRTFFSTLEIHFMQVV